MGKLLVYTFLVAVYAFVVYIPNVYVDASQNFPSIDCTDDTNCSSVTNATCDMKKCTCKGPFKISGAQCAWKVVGDTCAAPTDCPTGICNKTCACKTGYIADNGQCLLAVGKTCTKKSDCVSNAECDNSTKKCKCTSGYDDSKGLCLKHSGSDSSAISVRLTIPLLVMSVLTVVFERIQ